MFNKSETNNVKSEAVVQRCSVKKGVLRNFAKFTGKHLYQGLRTLFLQNTSSGCFCKVKSMESSEETLTKKIVAACSQFIKHNRKHIGEFQTQKMEMLGKTVAG